MHHEPSEDFAAAVAAGTESPEVGLRFATAVAAQMRYCDSVADAAPVAADSLLCAAAARADFEMDDHELWGDTKMRDVSFPGFF